MTSPLFLTTLPAATIRLAEVIRETKPAFLSTFYLSGGTALSLQLGHRESEDLDFFSTVHFEPPQLQQQLESIGVLHQTELAEGTLNAFLNEVKLQFLEYPYPLLRPTIDWNGIQLSSVIDIACTKLQTISARGYKKDFIDLFFLLQQYTLAELFGYLEQKYPKVNYSQPHILKSLLYFDDADAQPMPRMIMTAEWEQIKADITAAVRAVRL